MTKAANPSQALALVLVDELFRGGVRDACLSPGSRSGPVAMALAAEGRIRLHVSIDERSASFLALGIAKATGSPVALLSTSGTAAANLHPAVLEAHHSRTPLIVLTADRPPELRDTGASQTIDQIGLYGRSVRWFCEVGVPQEHPTSVPYWRSIGARACGIALGSPPGPVHLNLALREPLVPTEEEEGGWGLDLGGRAGAAPWTSLHIAPRAPQTGEAESHAAELRRAERGIVVAGAGTEAPESVAALAEALGWPLLADPLSGARLEGSIGAYEGLLRTESFIAVHRPQIVLRLGAGPLSKPLATFVRSADMQVLVDPHAGWLDPARSSHQVLAWNEEEACRALSPERAAGAGEWLASWRAADGRARAAIDRVLDGSEAPNEPRTARDVTASLPDGAGLVVASSMPLRDVESFMRPRRALRILANRGANGIDGFVSTTLGVALATDRPTTALCGDLSFLHDQNGLILAGKQRIDVTFVVINNDGGGIFSFLPQAEWEESFETLFGTPHGIDLERVSGVYGCGYELIEKAASLPAALEAAGSRAGTDVIEIRTDRAQNVRLHQQIWDAVAAEL